jgi:hypothetical protein
MVGSLYSAVSASGFVHSSSIGEVVTVTVTLALSTGNSQPRAGDRARWNFYAGEQQPSYRNKGLAMASLPRVALTILTLFPNTAHHAHSKFPKAYNRHISARLYVRSGGKAANSAGGPL